ncbi:MAG: hotdog fold thioesterase [Dehalococcoidia bacterium]|nr:hotdog fold thioesterase [Dehalococcoidia bacterium]
MARLGLEEIRVINRTGLPALLGIEVVEAREGFLLSRLELNPSHLAPNGYLHGGTLVTLADTSCGYGCVASLPEGGTGFATIELKANFLGTLLEGTLTCQATLAHGGRTTQVWDASIRDHDSGRPLALFRCTQLILYAGD